MTLHRSPQNASQELSAIQSSSSPRYWYLDAARGIAVVLMVAFHFTYLYYIEQGQIFDNPTQTQWIWEIIGDVIRYTFLFLVGFSMHLSWSSAQRKPEPLNTFIVRQGRRLFFLAAASFLVTLLSYLWNPALFIYWGILHHITLISFLYLFLTPLPALLLIPLFPLLVGLLLLIPDTTGLLPWILGVSLGTERFILPTVDYFPLQDWLLVSAAGFYMGVLWRFELLPLPLLPTPTSHFLRSLIWYGQHALLIYILHWPVIFLFILGIGTLT